MIYNVFHVSLLEQVTTRKRQVNEKTILEPKRKLEFEARDNKKYNVKTIIDNAIYG